MTDSGSDSEVALTDVAVLIPALDEEQSLPGLLTSLPDELGAVIVVDNGSVDRTAEVAAEHGAWVIRESERGYGAACLAGIAALEARQPPPEVIVFLDADHALGPTQIGALVAPILEGSADFTLGKRIPDPEKGGSVFVHAKAGNDIVLAFVRVMFGHRYTDMAPFRAIRTRDLARLEMDDRNWGWTLQMQIRAARKQLRILEVPMVHRPRSAGKSKISGSIVGTVRAGSKMFFTLARERFKR